MFKSGEKVKYEPKNDITEIITLKKRIPWSEDEYVWSCKENFWWYTEKNLKSLEPKEKLTFKRFLEKKDIN